MIANIMIKEKNIPTLEAKKIIEEMKSKTILEVMEIIRAEYLNCFQIYQLIKYSKLEFTNDMIKEIISNRLINSYQINDLICHDYVRLTEVEMIKMVDDDKLFNDSQLIELIRFNKLPFTNDRKKKIISSGFKCLSIKEVIGPKLMYIIDNDYVIYTEEEIVGMILDKSCNQVCFNNDNIMKLINRFKLSEDDIKKIIKAGFLSPNDIYRLICGERIKEFGELINNGYLIGKIYRLICGKYVKYNKNELEKMAANGYFSKDEIIDMFNSGVFNRDDEEQFKLFFSLANK